MPDAASLINNLSHALRLTPPSNGVLSVQHQDSGAEIIVEPLAGGAALAIHCRLGPAPSDGQDIEHPSLQDLLILNAPRPGGVPAAIGIDPATDEVILFSHLDLHADTQPDSLQPWFDDFCTVAIAWSTNYPHELPVAGTGWVAAPSPETGQDDVFKNLWREVLFARGWRPAEGDRLSSESFDVGGVINLSSGGYLLVSHDAPSSSVLVEAVLRDPAFEDGGDDFEYDDATLRHLLQAHLLGEATDGICFAIKPELEELVAFQFLPLTGLTANRLADRLDVLAHVATHFASMLGFSLPSSTQGLPEAAAA